MCPKCGAQAQPTRSTPALDYVPDRGSHRQPFSIDNDMGPVGTTETEAEDDVPECDDEADDDIEINSDLAKDTTEARRITNE